MAHCIHAYIEWQCLHQFLSLYIHIYKNPHDNFAMSVDLFRAQEERAGLNCIRGIPDKYAIAEL